MCIGLVTDSTSDIPGKLAESHKIKIVPAILVIDGKSIEDGKGITREDLYKQLPIFEIPPTTATPSVGAFEKVYDQLISEGVQKIISIHVSSLLSGIYATASLAAKSFRDKIVVIDSGQLSLGLGFQVLTAAEAISEDLPLEKVLMEIDDVQRRIRVYAMLDTLEYVQRSGRVSWARARIGTMLRIKPFLEIKDGLVLSLGQARTRQKGLKKLLAMYHDLGEIENLGILHTNAETDAHNLILEIGDNFQKKPIVVNVTTIVGTHVGPNALGFAAVIK
jgi:DegV family protein with EDD domain